MPAADCPQGDARSSGGAKSHWDTGTLHSPEGCATPQASALLQNLKHPIQSTRGALASHPGEGLGTPSAGSFLGPHLTYPQPWPLSPFPAQEGAELSCRFTQDEDHGTAMTCGCGHRCVCPQGPHATLQVWAPPVWLSLSREENTLRGCALCPGKRTGVSHPLAVLAPCRGPSDRHYCLLLNATGASVLIHRTRISSATWARGVVVNGGGPHSV